MIIQSKRCSNTKHKLLLFLVLFSLYCCLLFILSSNNLNKIPLLNVAWHNISHLGNVKMKSPKIFNYEEISWKMPTEKWMDFVREQDPYRSYCTASKAVIGENRVQVVPDSNCSAPYITVSNRGRLGNNVCELMSLLIFRKQFGMRIIISKGMYKVLNSLFEDLPVQHQPSSCFLKGSSKIIKDNYNNLRKKILAKLQNNQFPAIGNESFYIEEFPCALPDIVQYRNEFQSEFRIKKAFLSEAQKQIETLLVLKNLTIPNVTLISVHVRRKDYIKYAVKNKLIYPTEKYYNEAMDIFKNRLQSAIFVVVSDDMKWVKKMFKEPDIIFPGNADIKDPKFDYAMLSFCDHHIIGLGTFGRTSALLGKGSVCYPDFKTGRPTLTNWCTLKP